MPGPRVTNRPNTRQREAFTAARAPHGQSRGTEGGPSSEAAPLRTGRPPRAPPTGQTPFKTEGEMNTSSNSSCTATGKPGNPRQGDGPRGRGPQSRRGRPRPARLRADGTVFTLHPSFRKAQQHVGRREQHVSRHWPRGEARRRERPSGLTALTPPRCPANPGAASAQVLGNKLTRGKHEERLRDIPGGPGPQTPRSQCKRPGSTPGQGPDPTRARCCD